MAALTRAYVAVYEAGLVDAKLKELEQRLTDTTHNPSTGKSAT